MYSGTGQLTAEHQAWLSDLAHSFGFADVSHILEMQGFVFQEVGFFFFENDPVTPDSFWLQCLMGELPEEDLGPALTRLLQMQLLTLGQEGPIFGVDPTGKQLIASLPINSARLDTSQILLTLQTLVDMVQQWQAHRLGEPYDTTAKGPLATQIRKSETHGSTVVTEIKA